MWPPAKDTAEGKDEAGVGLWVTHAAGWERDGCVWVDGGAVGHARVDGWSRWARTGGWGMRWGGVGTDY